MKKINLSREEIKNILALNRIPSNMRKGSFGLTCSYNRDVALKFDLSLLKNYSEINENSIKSMWCNKGEIFVPQIERLARLQDKIKLSSLPQGVAYCEGIPVAIILKYFENHNNLLTLPCENNDDFLYVLFQINDIVDELCQNYIYQTDIKEDNFLYSRVDYKAQAIDLDGILLKLSTDENILDEETIYSALIDMYMFLIKEKLIASGVSDEKLFELMIIAKSFYHGIDGYYGVDSFLRSIQSEKILQKIKL